MGTIPRTPKRNFGAEGHFVAEDIIELHFGYTNARSSPSLRGKKRLFSGKCCP